MQSFGTITTEKWPTANQLPLWPACPPQHPEVDFTWMFPSLGVHGRDLLHVCLLGSYFLIHMFVCFYDIFVITCLQGLLVYDPGKRMKVKDALNHPFFEEN